MYGVVNFLNNFNDLTFSNTSYSAAINFFKPIEIHDSVDLNSNKITSDIKINGSGHFIGNLIEMLIMLLI